MLRLCLLIAIFSSFNLFADTISKLADDTKMALFYHAANQHYFKKKMHLTTSEADHAAGLARLERALKMNKVPGATDLTSASCQQFSNKSSQPPSGDSELSRFNLFFQTGDISSTSHSYSMPRGERSLTHHTMMNILFMNIYCRGKQKDNRYHKDACKKSQELYDDPRIQNQSITKLSVEEQFEILKKYVKRDQQKWKELYPDAVFDPDPNDQILVKKWFLVMGRYSIIPHSSDEIRQQMSDASKYLSYENKIDTLHHLGRILLLTPEEPPQYTISIPQIDLNDLIVGLGFEHTSYYVDYDHPGGSSRYLAVKGPKRDISIVTFSRPDKRGTGSGTSMLENGGDILSNRKKEWDTRLSLTKSFKITDIYGKPLANPESALGNVLQEQVQYHYLKEKSERPRSKVARISYQTKSGDLFNFFQGKTSSNDTITGLAFTGKRAKEFGTGGLVEVNGGISLIKSNSVRDGQESFHFSINPENPEGLKLLSYDVETVNVAAKGTYGYVELKLRQDLYSKKSLNVATSAQITGDSLKVTTDYGKVKTGQLKAKAGVDAKWKYKSVKGEHAVIVNGDSFSSDLKDQSGWTITHFDMNNKLSYGDYVLDAGYKLGKIGDQYQVKVSKDTSYGQFSAGISRPVGDKLPIFMPNAEKRSFASWKKEQNRRVPAFHLIFEDRENIGKTVHAQVEFKIK